MQDTPQACGSSAPNFALFLSYTADAVIRSLWQWCGFYSNLINSVISWARVNLYFVIQSVPFIHTAAAAASSTTLARLYYSPGYRSRRDCVGIKWGIRIEFPISRGNVIMEPGIYTGACSICTRAVNLDEEVEGSFDFPVIMIPI